jgi:Cytochrome P450
MPSEDLVESLLSILYLLKSHLFLLLTTLFILRLLYKRYATPLRNIPGPFIASFTRLWKLRQMYKGDMELTNIALHRKYGPIVRIGPNEVSLDDPESVKIIYGHATEFIKGPWYYASGSIHPENGVDLFTDTNEKRHSFNRRKVANAYSMTALLEMEQFVDNCSAIFMVRLGEFAENHGSMDLGHWLQCYAVLPIPFPFFLPVIFPLSFSLLFSPSVFLVFFLVFSLAFSSCAEMVNGSLMSSGKSHLLTALDS